MPMNLIETIQQARNVSVPIIYLRTWDPASIMQRLLTAGAFQSVDNPAEDVPVLRYDIAEGLSSPNDAGAAALNMRLPMPQGMPMIPPNTPPEQVQRIQLKARLDATTRPMVTLNLFETCPEGSILCFFILSPAEFFKDPVLIQKISSLRDKLKGDGRLLLFMGPQHELPAALAHDILMLNDSLPTHTDLEQIVRERAADTKEVNPDMVEPTPEEISTAADNMLGLTTFEAETAIALSFKYNGDTIGIDYTELREQRYLKIDETPGLTVWREGEDFENLKGLDGVKDELLLYANNTKRRIGGVIYLDEVDKLFAGGIEGGDNTGTADHFLRGLLMLLDELKAISFSFLGLPGTGKTAISKALGNHIQRPTISMNLDEMLSKYLGESQGNLHRAFATAKAVTGHCPIVIMSCNRDTHLPSSLLRRQRGGRVFFDLPGRPEKDQIWVSKMGIHGLEDQPLPNDERWTGAEIDIACEKASLVGRSLMDAASRIIPIASTRWQEVCDMREFAHGKYICARTGRPYVNGDSTESVPLEKTVDRKIVVNKLRGH